jgi:hypothetical protein
MIQIPQKIRTIQVRKIVCGIIQTKDTPTDMRINQAEFKTGSKKVNIHNKDNLLTAHTRLVK